MLSRKLISQKSFIVYIWLGFKYASALVTNLCKVFFCFTTFMGKWWQVQEIKLKEDFVLIATVFTSKTYLEANSIFSVSATSIAKNIINTDINFWKTWTFMMGAIISFKGCNFFTSKPVIWQFFFRDKHSWENSSYIKFTKNYRTVLKWRRKGEWYSYFCKLPEFKPSVLPPKSPKYIFFDQNRLELS